MFKRSCSVALACTWSLSAADQRPHLSIVTRQTWSNSVGMNTVFILSRLISCIKIKQTQWAFFHRLGSSSTELKRSDFNMRKGVRPRAGHPGIRSQTWPSWVQTKASFCLVNACVFKTPTQCGQTLLQRHRPLTQTEWHFSRLADGLLCKVRASLTREWADGMFGVKATPEPMQRITRWTINLKNIYTHMSCAYRRW